MENEIITKNSKERNSVFSTDNSYKRALDVAKNIASSDLVPDTYRNKPSNCLIALDVARQVNSSPLIVMQNLHIIKGKPSWSSSYIAGAIKSRYRKIKLFLDGEGENRGCKVVAYDEDGEILAEGVRVTMKMAREEKWIDKLGSKWKTMPDLMLQYRANAFFGRVHCPDVLIGLQSEYEVIDVRSRSSVSIDDVVAIDDPFKDTVKAEVEVQVKKEEEVERIPVEEPEELEEVEVIKKGGCEECGEVLTPKVKKYSLDKFNKNLCFSCQKKQ